MAGIALSGVGKIFSIGLAIKDAVATDRRNMKEFRGMETCVDRVYSILWCLRGNTHLAQHPVINDTLDDLANSLQEALDLINDCQGRSAIARLLKDGNTAKELRRVKDDIDQKLLVGMFAGMVQIITFTATIQLPQGRLNITQISVLILLDRGRRVAHSLLCLLQGCDLSDPEISVSELLDRRRLASMIFKTANKAFECINSEYLEEPVRGTHPEPRIVEEPIVGTNSGPQPFTQETRLISVQAQHPARDDDNGCHSSNCKGPSAAISVQAQHPAKDNDKTLPRRPISLKIQRDARAAPGHCTRPPASKKTPGRSLVATCPPRGTNKEVVPERRPWR